MITQYRSVLDKTVEAAIHRDDHLKAMKSPNMLKKQQEMEEKMKRLKEIERQLGMFVDRGVRAESTVQVFYFCNLLLISNLSVSTFRVSLSKTREAGS